MMWKTKATATTETQAENAFILGFFTYKQPLDGDKLPSGKPELSDLYLFDSVGKRKEESLTENDEAVKKWLENHDVDLAKFHQVWQGEELKNSWMSMQIFIVNIARLQHLLLGRIDVSNEVATTADFCSALAKNA